MSVFVSVDVETTSPNPYFAIPLTVGLKPVLYVPGVTPEFCSEELYIRIDNTSHLKNMGWFDGTNRDNNLNLDWWLMQDDQVIDEAWRDTSLERVSHTKAAFEIMDFIDDLKTKYGVPHCYFVSDPAAFDKPVIDALISSACDYTQTPQPQPSLFHWRSLCLRSMRFGMIKVDNWSNFLPDLNDSRVPHHALYDAKAQAAEFCDLVALRDGILYDVDT